MLFLLFLYCTILLTTRSHGAELFEFGVEQGDQVLSFSNDSYAVTLDVPIIYFEESQNELFISSKGIVTFGKAADVTEMTDLDQERINAIAIFFAQNSAGKIFYRATSSDTNLLNDLTDKIRKNFPNRELSDFTALHAVVITWSNIEGEDAEQGLNEFQMVLVTDGMSSYVFLIYDQITWTGKNGHYAQAGLYCSDGRRETMVNSGTPNIRELVNLSNNQKEGTYIFRISGATPEDPRGTLVEDDYNYNDYEQDYDSDNEHKRQHKLLSEHCPTDPYRDQCPVECHVLTDDRGCSLCVCARLFFPRFYLRTVPKKRGFSDQRDYTISWKIKGYYRMNNFLIPLHLILLSCEMRKKDGNEETFFMPSLIPIYAGEPRHQRH